MPCYPPMISNCSPAAQFTAMGGLTPGGSSHGASGAAVVPSGGCVAGAGGMTGHVPVSGMTSAGHLGQTTVPRLTAMGMDYNLNLVSLHS